MELDVLFGKLICPAVFVISNKSLNQNKNDQEAGMWLWPTRLYWKSKAIRRVSHIEKYVQRIG